MAPTRFRFVETSSSALADAQFWRDAEASDRMGSRFKANLFLRELCRSKAWDGRGELTLETREANERDLLRDVLQRGFRLVGADVEPVDVPPLARAS